MNNVVSLRVPPNSTGAERALLALALSDGEMAVRAAEGIVTAADFYSTANGAIWQAACAVVARRHACDTVTIRAELERSGVLQAVGSDEYLMGLVDLVPDTSAETYAKMIRDDARRRDLIRICHEQAAVGYSHDIGTADYIAQTEAKVFATARDALTADGGLESTKAGLVRFWEHTQAIAKSGGIVGVRTGIPSLDTMLSGMWDEDLVVVAGRPSMGKSAFGETLLLNVASRLGHDECALFFSAEMGSVTLWPRLLAKLSRVDSRMVRTMPSHMPEADRRAVIAAVDVAATLPMSIDYTSGITIAQIRSRARKAAIGKRVRLIVVDYLQIVRPSTKHERRDLEVAEVAIGLKELAKELKCPVVGLAQINRGSTQRTDKRPMLSDLKESGMIEQAADTVIMLHREGYYDPTGNGDMGAAEIIVGKCRNGVTGIVPARYLGHLCEFVEWEQRT